MIDSVPTTEPKIKPDSQDGSGVLAVVTDDINVDVGTMVEEPLMSEDDRTSNPSSDDTASSNQDRNQKVSMIFTTLFEIYRVLMSSLLLMFVPQQCGDAQCSLNDKVFPDNDYEKFVAISNYIAMTTFFVFYYYEVTREMYFINYLHTNRFKSRDNDSVEVAMKQLDDDRKEKIENAADTYRTMGYVCTGGFAFNTVVSSVAVFSNFLDSKTITVMVTNVMFMSLKLYDVYFVTNTKKHIFLSAYLNRKVQFNDVDPDKVIGVADQPQPEPEPA